MPSGLKRFQKAEVLHFITFSCFHRLPLLQAAGARETVEAVLEAMRARQQARVYAYVFIPEHIHLLVNEPPRIVLAQFLKAVKQVTSRKLKGRREKFWQDRYYGSNVYGEKARSEMIRYIQRNPGSPAREFCALGWNPGSPAREFCALGWNPVARGLVTKPEQWPWSSFRHYASGVKGPVEIESQWTAFLRGIRLPEGVRLREGERSCFLTQAAKDAAWMGHNPSRENQKRNSWLGHPPRLFFLGASPPQPIPTLHPHS